MCFKFIFIRIIFIGSFFITSVNFVMALNTIQVAAAPFRQLQTFDVLHPVNLPEVVDNLRVLDLSLLSDSNLKFLITATKYLCPKGSPLENRREFTFNEVCVWQRGVDGAYVNHGAIEIPDTKSYDARGYNLITSSAITADGNVLVFGFKNGDIFVFHKQPDSSRYMVLQRIENSVPGAFPIALALNKNGQGPLFAAGFNTGIVKIWSKSTNFAEVFSLKGVIDRDHNSALFDIRGASVGKIVLCSGKIILGYRDGCFKVCDLSNLLSNGEIRLIKAFNCGFPSACITGLLTDLTGSRIIASFNINHGEDQDIIGIWRKESLVSPSFVSEQFVRANDGFSCLAQALVRPSENWKRIILFSSTDTGRVLVGGGISPLRSDSPYFYKFVADLGLGDTPISGLVTSMDGRTVVSASKGGIINVWSLDKNFIENIFNRIVQAKSDEDLARAPAAPKD